MTGKTENSVLDALRSILPGQRVFAQGGAATPSHLLRLFTEVGAAGVELCHLHTMGPAPWAERGSRFKTTGLFVGANLRSGFKPGVVDYLPSSLAELSTLVGSEKLPLDVALVHVSPPDRHGYCSLGTSVDLAGVAVRRARRVIAQINPQMPRVHGDGFVHESVFSASIRIDEPLPEQPRIPLDPIHRAIARQVAALVEEGSTLQIGIGGVPDAVLGELRTHRNLGLHTEMWSDGALELLKCGAIDNSRKRIQAGKSVSGFVIGSRELYDYVDDNPSVVQLDIGYVNDPATIALNPKVVAINSAVEVDLTGQVCADSVGHRIISGAGGQMDYVLGASHSVGGKSIIALPSRTRWGSPRIVPALKPGAGVVTPRAYTRFVVTEYGSADLQGLTLGARADALMAIAHPEDREGLRSQWRKNYEF